MTGEPDSALEFLRDPSLSLSRVARDLRHQSVQLMSRLVRQRASEGRFDESERLLRALAREDPALAQRLGADLQAERNAAEPSPEEGPQPGGDASRLRALLAEMRSRAQPPPRGAEPAGRVRAPQGAAADSRHNGNGGDVLRLLMGVDDMGEFLVASGEALVVGHSRSATAQLPFLADVDDEHARIGFRPGNFHRAPGWTLEPLGERPLRVNGHPLARGGRHLLCDGDEVELATNLGFVVRAPSSASSSLVLDLHEGAETLGAQRVLLLSPGGEGKVTIGARPDDHAQVPGLQGRIEIELAEARLAVRAQVGLRRIGSGGEPERLIELDLPPRVRLDLALQPSEPRARLFGFSFRPIEL